jgi:hypothetical protein
MPELNLHWTDDQDLLAMFVLNRVSAAARQGLEAHLSTCEQCRRAVQAEQLLVAGIKRAGREELKARLKERVALRRRFEVTWYQVAGAAAAIVVLVSIGIYSRWFGIGEKEREPLAVQEHLEVGKLSTPPDRSKLAEKGKEKGEAPAAGAGTSRPRGPEKGMVTEALPAPVEAKSRRAAEPEVAPLQIAAAQAGKEAEALSKGTSEVTTMWVEGTVLSHGIEDRAAPQLYAPLAGKKSAELRDRKNEAQALTAQKQQDFVGGKEKESTIVAQRSLPDLPVSRKARQQEKNTIETLFQRTSGRLHVTVYLDTLVSEPELQTARIMPIGEDSIILNLGSQRIGYKMPPGWRQVLAPETGKER